MRQGRRGLALLVWLRHVDSPLQLAGLTGETCSGLLLLPELALQLAGRLIQNRCQIYKCIQCQELLLTFSSQQVQ